jgi:hypothetical protein
MAPPDEADAFFRILVRAGEIFVLFANAAKSGFDRVGPDLSRALLDACSDVLSEGHALQTMQAASCFEAATEVLRDASTGEEPAAGTLLIANIRGDAATVLWVGPDEAWLIREGRVVARTRGDVLSGPGAPEGGIVTRVIGGGGEPSRPASLAGPWIVRAGDKMIILSRSIVRAAEESTILKSALAGDAQAVAEELVALAAGSPSEVYAAAVVVQT